MMTPEMRQMASLMNTISEGSLLRAFGQRASINEQGYIDGLLTAYYVMGGLDSEDFLRMDVRKAFRSELPPAGIGLDCGDSCKI